MLNRSASLAMSTSILKALPGKLDIKRHSPSILYVSIPDLIVVFPYHIHLLFFVCLSSCISNSRASDFFQDWWAEVTHGVEKWWVIFRNGGPKHIKLTTA